MLVTPLRGVTNPGGRSAPWNVSGPWPPGKGLRVTVARFGASVLA